MAQIPLSRRSLLLVVAAVAFVVVTVAVVVFLGISDRREKTADGHIEVSEVQISSRGNGRILDICVSVGDYVNIGDTLAVVDLATLEEKAIDEKAKKTIDEKMHNSFIILQRAKEGLESAQKSYHKMQQLFDEGVITADVLNGALANYKLMEGQVIAVQNMLRQLQTGIGETVIVAHVSGEVGDIYLSENDMITPDTPIMNVLLMDDLWGSFYFDETELQNYELGKNIVVHVSAFKKDIKMRIYDIAETAASSLGADRLSEYRFVPDGIKVKARPVDDVDGLRPGMVLRIKE